MFRMADSKPRLVLGFEPSVQHYYCFKALNAMAGRQEIDIDLLGVEHLTLFDNCFDVIFLMGIIYHRPSPIDTLRDILSALKPGGTLLVESQAIPGEAPFALFPDETYAKVPGTYFVPTGNCLCNWMKKAGFVDINLFCSHPMSSAEQRQTDWMTFESYNDFIDPANRQLTVEGYPAPYRVFIKGRKKE
jgi:tRNA (mo5U34)-methyltransferase